MSEGNSKPTVRTRVFLRQDADGKYLGSFELLIGRRTLADGGRPVREIEIMSDECEDVLNELEAVTIKLMELMAVAQDEDSTGYSRFNDLNWTLEDKNLEEG